MIVTSEDDPVALNTTNVVGWYNIRIEHERRNVHVETAMRYSAAYPTGAERYEAP